MSVQQHKARAGKTGQTVSVVNALIYTRVSKDDQADGVSLDAQLAMAREYVAQNGWAIANEYQDILSGKRDDRAAYQALLADVRQMCAQGRVTAVVVARLDRFGRRVLERVRAREELKALGVSTHSVREGGEVSDLVANILASVAEEESRRLGERVADARRHITGHGWYYPGRIPWGYLHRDATPEERAAGSPRRMLDVDPDTASYVREAFRMVQQGSGLHGVARWIGLLPNAARRARHALRECARALARTRLRRACRERCR
jgi:DNA invertase Pin-like site-specific DNA recombinase